MKDKKEKEKLLQWHPAFFAGLQIELAEEAEYLSFESEHYHQRAAGRNKPVAV